MNIPVKKILLNSCQQQMYFTLYANMSHKNTMHVVKGNLECAKIPINKLS